MADILGKGETEHSKEHPSGDQCRSVHASVHPKKLNITDNETHGGHAIVLVGYNETNATVCYNDPSAGLWHDDINGTYVYAPKEMLRNAVRNTTGTKYVIWALHNTSTSSPPPTAEERFKRAHEQNLRRMKGYLGAYLGFALQIPAPLLGIHALTALHRDLRIGIVHRMMTIMQYRQYQYAYYDFQTISIEKHNVSQYLFENENLSEVCFHDALLLQQESNEWKNLSILVWEIYDIGQNHSYIDTLLLSQPIIKQVTAVVASLITIEQKIIMGETISV